MTGTPEELELDDLEVEIVDEAEEAGEYEEKAMPAEEGIAELKRQLDAEREARAAAERRANDASKSAYQAKIDKDDSDIHLVSNAIDTLRNNSDALKENYAYAMQNGDYKMAADIQADLSDASAKLLQLQQGLEAMKSKPKEAPPAAHADPVEAFASQLSHRSADWVRKNPQFVTDPRLNRKMIRAHEDAMDDGIAADTPEYFAAIESKLGVSKAAARAEAASDTGDQYAAKVTQRRDAAPAAAPVTRGSSTRSNVVRLTGAEREMAEMMNMKPEEYAKNKMALLKEGKIK